MENDMRKWDKKISDMMEMGKEMEIEGKFDEKKILSKSRRCKEKFIKMREKDKKSSDEMEE